MFAAFMWNVEINVLSPVPVFRCPSTLPLSLAKIFIVWVSLCLASVASFPGMFCPQLTQLFSPFLRNNASYCLNDPPWWLGLRVVWENIINTWNGREIWKVLFRVIIPPFIGSEWWGIVGKLETSAGNRLIGEVVQTRRRPLLGPSPGWKRLLPLSHLRHY